MKDSEVVVIDKKAASAFLHDMSHLKSELELIPKEIFEMEFTNRIGKRDSIKGYFDHTQSRIEKLGNYIKLAMHETK